MVRLGRLILVVLLMSLSFVPRAGAQETQSAPISGKDLFAAHCAACHGSDGKGAAEGTGSEKSSPADLTQIAKRNNGRFPSMRVTAIIDGEYNVPPHEVRAMPVWGPVFRARAHGRLDSAQVQIMKLVRYLQSIQEK